MRAACVLTSARAALSGAIALPGGRAVRWDAGELLAWWRALDAAA